MIIGVYGRIGSGKTTFCNYLRTKGFYVINGDKISREILMPGKIGLSQVIDAFGHEYLNADGTLNRKKLGEYVFSHPEALKRLNAITHPLITAEVKEQIDAHSRQHIVIEGAVLYATDIVKFCDKTVVTKSDATLKRIMARDFLTEEEALSRINAQEIYEQADFILENNGTLPEFYQKIDRMLDNIL
ncbi:MAG: dephospho-CoA kinase [Ruminococcaceae bacterium]|nr:dephospho-CoA kinase [Oscillospiraceae bacterium]